MPATFHALRVRDVELLTDDSAAVTFEVPDDLAAEFAFVPGQSLTLRRGDERRQYSIASPAGSMLRVGVREIPEGLFSQWLVRELRPGDEVEVLAPGGRFCPDPAMLEGGRHLCIAAGSGITPMLSVAASVLAAGGEVTLLYGNRTSGSVMFAEELADLKNRYGPQLQLVHVLSREPREVDLFSGRLDAERLRRLLTTVAPAGRADHVWLCGPHAMIEDAREVLDELGVAADRVHFELFYVDAPPPELERPDVEVSGATVEVTVVLDGSSATASLPASKSVLDGAAVMRSDLPFACKGGVCGTCRAKVTAGEVDMRRNYALEPAEVDAGFVLTCQSYPLGEAVTVDFDA
ncbi:phenylacetate-CoA oxygenase/reductase subunit PaaK [Nocardioides mangrovicus]|uniref:Phenylacetate-CoA oxygenase/reductase subunit PaaK n=1 Tax=Nocardioides mangrovicus TaxID=2478913 RepID=A0A3L8P696_9ACTN|nr:1,2-phenylacetyl-CoA epoxidase subunit PaaE [Nocardioides mangrovicus]RLV50751.1 phenylacetate-CoA oxygenase/reductase subunit PaaK [Nocardioides mangrovicus]